MCPLWRFRQKMAMPLTDNFDPVNRFMRPWVVAFQPLTQPLPVHDEPHRDPKYGKRIRTPAMQAGRVTRQLCLRDLFRSTATPVFDAVNHNERHQHRTHESFSRFMRDRILPQARASF